VLLELTLGMAKISLAKSHSQLAAQADRWDASLVTAGCPKKLPWKSEIGHSWNANVANQTKGKGLVANQLH